MPSTHLSLHFHIIFTPKHRRPDISAQWRARLHAFLGGTVRRLDGIPEAVGGTADHVHLLLGLRATQNVADVLRELKSASSRWIHATVGAREFAWQDGYGAFTVSASKLAVVKRYIERQEEHHRRRTFQEEYVDFLKESGVEFDARYLW